MILDWQNQPWISATILTSGIVGAVSFLQATLWKNARRKEETETLAVENPPISIEPLKEETSTENTETLEHLEEMSLELPSMELSPCMLKLWHTGLTLMEKEKSHHKLLEHFANELANLTTLEETDEKAQELLLEYAEQLKQEAQEITPTDDHERFEVKTALRPIQETLAQINAEQMEKELAALRKKTGTLRSWKTDKIRKQLEEKKNSLEGIAVVETKTRKNKFAKEIQQHENIITTLQPLQEALRLQTEQLRTMLDKAQHEIRLIWEAKEEIQRYEEELEENAYEKALNKAQEQFSTEIRDLHHDKLERHIEQTENMLTRLSQSVNKFFQPLLEAKQEQVTKSQAIKHFVKKITKLQLPEQMLEASKELEQKIRQEKEMVDEYTQQMLAGEEVQVEAPNYDLTIPEERATLTDAENAEKAILNYYEKIQTELNELEETQNITQHSLKDALLTLLAKKTEFDTSVQEKTGEWLKEMEVTQS